MSSFRLCFANATNMKIKDEIKNSIPSSYIKKNIMKHAKILEFETTFIINI